MARSEQAISSFNTIAASVAIVVSLLLPPTSYAVVAYLNLVAAMETEEEIHGASVNQAVAVAPQLWAFQEIRFTELLSRHGQTNHPPEQFLRLVDDKGTVVAAVGNPAPWPTITHTVTVFDAGRPVGRLEIQRSLRGLLLNTGLLSLLGAALAAGMFMTLRVIPMRAMQRKNEILQKRDALLHAVAVSSTQFVTAPSLDEAIPTALEAVSRAIHIDRMLVLENPPTPNRAPLLRYVWHGPAVQVKVDAAFFDNAPFNVFELAQWMAPLSEGRTVITYARSAAGEVKRLVDYLGIKSMLMVPVSVDGQYWGQIAFDTVTGERQWPEFEIEILKSMAELIGNAIRRERYVKEIANANRIVQNTPTILYRMRGEPSLPLIYISQNIKLFGYDPDMLVASPRFYQAIIHPDDAPSVRELMAGALEKDSQPSVFDFRLLTSQGAYRWVENHMSPIRDTKGRISEVEGLLIDITERRVAEEKIAHLARTDALTGLANRATFIERLRHAFAAAQRGAPAFAVLYIDLDRFKDINDTLGHPIGDVLLKTIADRLRACTRETDVVGRPGGDEFAILQAELSDTADAGALATKVRDALAAPIRIEGNELHITASVGISTFTPDIAGPDDMLAQADLALYRAKDEGRDQYRFHSEELDQQVRHRVAIADELRGAIERNEFEILYQPQVELSSGRIAGMEALIRWNHPTRGQLKPGAFLPIAEKTGGMIAIGKWVLDRACEQMNAWRKAGVAPATLAVNVSLAQLKAANEFVQFVGDTLKRWGLAPADLELDVTESMLAHATLAQNDVIERLQKLGVKIAIDDFGTKYSSLDYLKTYRVSRLKIPPTMIAGATKEKDNGAMVRAIIGIARELNIEVVAQGVETEAQWSFLTMTSPTTKVQGYYYSEPVPADRAGELLHTGRIRPAADEKPAVARG